MNIQQLNSDRFFAISFIEHSTGISKQEHISDILTDNKAEYRYAMQENIDAILDLKVGERLQMNFNRDNPDSAGFIKRIKPE